MSGDKPRRQARPGNPGALAEEICLLRDLLRQLQERMEDDPPMKELLSLAEGLGRTTTRLATLLRVEQALNEVQSEAPAVDELLGRLVLRAQQERQKEAEKNGRSTV